MKLTSAVATVSSPSRSSSRLWLPLLVAAMVTAGTTVAASAAVTLTKAAANIQGAADFVNYNAAGASIGAYGIYIAPLLNYDVIAQPNRTYGNSGNLPQQTAGGTVIIADSAYQNSLNTVVNAGPDNTTINATASLTQTGHIYNTAPYIGFPGATSYKLQSSPCSVGGFFQLKVTTQTSLALSWDMNALAGAGTGSVAIYYSGPDNNNDGNPDGPSVLLATGALSNAAPSYSYNSILANAGFYTINFDSSIASSLSGNNTTLTTTANYALNVTTATFVPEPAAATALLPAIALLARRRR